MVIIELVHSLLENCKYLTPWCEGLGVEGRVVHTNTNTDHNQREPALGMDGYGRMVFLCWRWHRNCKVLG